MNIVKTRQARLSAPRRFQSQLIWAVVCVAPPLLATEMAQAQVPPPLPNIGLTDYNVTISNASIDNGAVAVGNDSTVNTGVLNSFIAYASTHGGGTVEIPAGTFLTSTLTMKSDVNLQVDANAVLQNTSTERNLITTSGVETDVEISGSGILNDNATVATGITMLNLDNVTRLEVTGVSIENSAGEHLVVQSDTNATINDVTITDPLGTLANADGIDFSGTNFLIENSSISDGDDDIVAKPQAVFTSNIVIQNDTILMGHGISIGGQTNAGLNNMTVNNITFNGTNNGFRLKAGRGNGGIVQNISYNNVTMTNVANPIYISSWYTNGGDDFPGAPLEATNVTYNTTTTPLWQNINFSNITSTDIQGNDNSGIIYGLPEAPVQALTFNNVNISSGDAMKINFAGYNGAYTTTPNPAYEVLFENSSINGIPVTPGSLSNNNMFIQPEAGLYDDDIVITVPEPGSLSLMAAGIALLAKRRRHEHAT
jgi:polygalacturonase